jgi:hypothetical protein
VVPDNSLIVVVDKTRPYWSRDQRIEDVQPICSKCGIQHFHKTTHLQLRAGSVIVSEAVWANMQLLIDDGGFEFVNPVPDPPAQGMTPGEETQLFEKYVSEITSARAGKGGK